jgi:putative endopeptidase
VARLHDVTISRNSLLDNVLARPSSSTRRNIAKLGKPVDRKGMGMTPPTVNAYYNPRMNEIVFPAGILQPPFFDAERRRRGQLRRHRHVHRSRDDPRLRRQGRKFDADGNLKDWWTPEDASSTGALRGGREAVRRLRAVDTLHINGKLTLGENTADLGGASIAYGAMQKAIAGKSRPRSTASRRSSASSSRSPDLAEQPRPEAMKLRINTDPHSPGEFRCIGRSPTCRSSLRPSVSRKAIPWYGRSARRSGSDRGAEAFLLSPGRVRSTIATANVGVQDFGGPSRVRPERSNEPGPAT